MRIAVFFAYDFKAAQVILPFLRGLAVRIAGRECNALAVLRPCKAIDTVLNLRQLLRLTAVRMYSEDLVLIANTIAGKGEPLAVIGPLGITRRLFSTRELKRFARRHLRQPDLRNERILLPVRFVDGVGNPFAVGRDLRTTKRFDVEQVVN